MDWLGERDAVIGIFLEGEQDKESTQGELFLS